MVNVVRIACQKYYGKELSFDVLNLTSLRPNTVVVTVTDSMDVVKISSELIRRI
jgi:hypothetical protein